MNTFARSGVWAEANGKVVGIVEDAKPKPCIVLDAQYAPVGSASDTQ